MGTTTTPDNDRTPESEELRRIKAELSARYGRYRDDEFQSYTDSDSLEAAPERADRPPLGAIDKYVQDLAVSFARSYGADENGATQLMLVAAYRAGYTHGSRDN